MRRALAIALGALALLPTLPAAARADSDGDGAGALPAELSLEAALRIGRRLQPQLRQARAQTEAAEARVDEARAGLLPQVSLNLNYTRATNNFAPTGGGTQVGNNKTPEPSFDTYNFFRNSITANQLIWDFGQTWQ